VNRRTLAVKVGLLLVALLVGHGSAQDNAAAPTATPIPPIETAPVVPAVPVRAADVEPLAVGAALPDVDVKSSNGQAVPLKSLLSEEKLVLIFYRGGWCPYCNTHLAELKKLEPQIKASGARLVGLCMDKPEVLARYEMDHALPFQLLSDSAADAARAFRVAYRVTDDEVARLKTAGIDLMETSGHSHKLLPVPSVFVIDQKGTIVYRFYSPDYRKRIDSDKLLKVLGN
jgi:peroxiredoxin